MYVPNPILLVLCNALRNPSDIPYLLQFELVLFSSMKHDFN